MSLAAPNASDRDGDGLSDDDELALGTDPDQADSDGDGLADGEEVALGTDPIQADTDGDGLADGEEVALGTDPMQADSDGDGLSDGDEVSQGSDPLQADADGVIAHLSWDAPTTNADGTPLTDLAGYRLHYRAASASTFTQRDLGNTTSQELCATDAASASCLPILQAGLTYVMAVSAWTRRETKARSRVK